MTELPKSAAERKADGAVPIRSAATVVLLRDTPSGLQVFVLQRVPGMVFAPNMVVFPGGAVDPPDDQPVAIVGDDPGDWAEILDTGPEQIRLSLIAATRELFEESGVALISRPEEVFATIDALPHSVRARLADHHVSWPEILREAGLQIRADLLRPWVRWLTPLGMVRRYDTCFFVAALPPGQIADFNTSEASGGFWTTPADALAAAAAGRLSMMPPTRGVLTELTAYRSVAAVLAARPEPRDGPAPTSATESLIRASALTRSRLAPNSGPMTLDGTNSYVLSGPGSATSVVVDPGPLDPEHLRELAATGVELVLITHHHADHTAAGAAFHALTGAPVRALDPAFCHGAGPLVDGESITAGGVRIQVLATPGHTADSVCFVLPDDEDGRGSVLTGDTILGRGTTIIAHPDGRLSPYLQSLDRLAGLGHQLVLPAHGPVLPDIAVVAAMYSAHRQERLAQIRQALAVLGTDADVGSVTDAVYTDIDPSVRPAAERSVAAQLEYLRPSS